MPRKSPFNPERPFTVLLHPERHRTRAVEVLLALVDTV